MKCCFRRDCKETAVYTTTQQELSIHISEHKSPTTNQKKRRLDPPINIRVAGALESQNELEYMKYLKKLPQKVLLLFLGVEGLPGPVTNSRSHKENTERSDYKTIKLLEYKR